MTIIAWDGKTLAADKQSTSHGLGHTVTKIFRVTDTDDRFIGLVGFVGSQPHALELLHWFRNGMHRSTWPDSKTPGESADALFISPQREILAYIGTPHAQRYEDKFIAMGCGRDYAITALHLGKTAKEAVEIACLFDIQCGKGVDVLDFDEVAK